MAVSADHHHAVGLGFPQEREEAISFVWQVRPTFLSGIIRHQLDAGDDDPEFRGLLEHRFQPGPLVGSKQGL